MLRRQFLKNISTISFIGLTFNNNLLKALNKLDSNQIYTEKTIQIFNKIINTAKEENYAALNIGDLVAKVAKHFLGIPYVAGTLDKSNNELCNIDLEGLDCVTFFESSLCIARIIKSGKTNFNSLINEITYTRYRSGKIIDYTSRLHYTSDWITDNIKKKVINNISQSLGGKEFDFNVSFMSSNPKYYKQLKDNPVLVKKIKDIEDQVNAQTIFYIPKHMVAKAETKINNGDIIAITTNKKGLDYSHTGIAYKENDTVHFMHASLNQKKVIIDKRLSEYLSSIKSDTGISVLRPCKI